MIHFRFDRLSFETMLAAVRDGGPIPHSGPWTRNDMLTLAGVLFFGAMSHGPATRTAGEHPERREAAEESLLADIHAAIEFLGSGAQRLNDGQYDAAFGPVVEALIDGTAKAIQPVRGFIRTEVLP